MYRFFESLIDPLRPTPASQPPEKTLSFFWFYLAPIKGVLLSTLVLSGIAALSELYVYIYLGRILDWMTEADRESFLTTHSTALIWMAIVVIPVSYTHLTLPTKA